MKVTQSYHFNPDAGNIYQGDQLSFNITIKGEQMAQVNGYTTVALENKVQGSGDIWDILIIVGFIGFRLFFGGVKLIKILIVEGSK